MSLVIAVVTLLATVLLPAGGAQASLITHSIVPGAARSRAADWSAQTRGVRRAALARQRSGPAKRTVAAGARDVRRACAAPKRRGLMACLALVRTNVPHQKGLFAPGTAPSGYGPADLQSAYSLPSATGGAGQTVAIVDAFDDPNAEADLQAYRAQYGLPVCDTANGCFEKVNQQGQQGNYPAPNVGWAEEESLDMDMVSAICPNCHILLVEANDNDVTGPNLEIAVNEAVTLGAKYVSNSYGGGEFPSQTTEDTQYYDHPGVAVTASAGDSGYGAQYPAASQYVTAVGGTSLTRDTGVPRGWSESAWRGTGSGCSAYDPKPAWQRDTGCSNRTIADVSAVADPNTGVAVYDTYTDPGWEVFGGTSVSSPIIASTFALAGTPAAGTYPSSYPYADPSALNDVTSGANGTCTPAYLCTAEPGYDGPTGLGTPGGLAAFTPVSYGTVAGTVTDVGTGKPLSGAEVDVGSFAALTDSSGHYTDAVPAGSYTATAKAFGHTAKTVTGVQVTADQTTTVNFGLTGAPTTTLSGTVTDGSGHGWPLYATVSVPGTPLTPVYTNPYTGAYSITVPEGATYQVQAVPVSPGYKAKTESVAVGKAAKEKNIKVAVDPSSCTAPGYAFEYQGAGTQFTGWSGASPQDGWSITDGAGDGQTWNFSNPGHLSPPPGGDSDFASVDSNYYGAGGYQDTSLTSPVVNLTGVTSPEIGFGTNLETTESATANLELSLDGGQTWATLRHWTWRNSPVQGRVIVKIPQAAGQPDVQVRFRYTGRNSYWWAIDNVVIGTATCAPTPGGLISGSVTNDNTGDAINGATVASRADPADSGISAATPADPNLPDGFYEFFSPLTGSQKFTASYPGYQASTATVTTTAGGLTRHNWVLKAGRVSVNPASISATVGLGGSASQQVTFTNTGTAPARISLGEQDAGFTPQGVTAAAPAPLQRIKVKGRITPGAMALQHNLVMRGTSSSAPAKPGVAPKPLVAGSPMPDAAPWAGLADYPVPIMDNAVAYDGTGKVYSVAGYDGTANTASGYAYDPIAQQWAPIASAPQPLDVPAGAFLDGKMYLVGGWNAAIAPVASVYAYDPSSNSWSQTANLPAAIAAASAAVLGGQLYVIGGCTTARCSPASQAVYRYNPASGIWVRRTDYPAPVAFAACAGVDREIVCAGGVNPDNGQSSTSTYIYHPSSNTWTSGAAMPYDDWGMAYSGAGNKLQIAGGVTARSTAITNQAAQYDPAANAWSTLPDAANAEYRGGGSCGMYQVGGSAGGLVPTSSAQVLPGYDQCGLSGVPWLSENATSLNLAPGHSATVTVTADSSAVNQPGTYAATLTIGTGSPYPVQPAQGVSITLRVNPPRSWGKITGTVTGAATGSPLTGATVQVGTLGGTGQVTFTLTTNAEGGYQLWLDHRYSPLQVIAFADGYQPQTKNAAVTQGKTTTLNFALQKNGG